MKPSEYALDDPIAAIATALVPAALGIVRTSGRLCIELLASRFSRPEALLSAGGNTLVHGWIVSTPATGARRIDEVMLAVYRSPKSFTGEDAVEVIGHGGPAAVLAIYRELVSAGFRPAERGEFTFRSFASGKTDLARAEAVREIIDARTDTARSRAAGRLSGGLTGEVGGIRNLILTALAAIEVEIEYPEDEETVRGAFDTRRIAEACARLSLLESSWAAEKLYQDGARVVLAGRTNAGKSSIFNTLLKEERAIVSETHGTTRDWLESRADFRGIPVSLFDTAGLRETGDEIEAEGVVRSRVLASEADLLLYLVDGTEGLDASDRDFLSGPEAGGGQVPVILVWNKCDRGSPLPVPGNDGLWSASCAVSAKTGAGISELVSKAAELLLGDADRGAPVRAAGLGTERQKIAVRDCLASLEHALAAAGGGFPLDAVGQDLEDALGALGEITGEVTSAEILDTVFSGFCVGK